VNNRLIGARAAAHLIEGRPREYPRAHHFWVTWSPQQGEMENSGGHVKKNKKILLDEMTLVAVLRCRMKNKSPIRIGLGVLAALTLHISGNLYGSYLYEDTFSANPGALNGRTTASGFGSWTTTDSAFQVGSDQITINTNSPVDYHEASFSLPTLGATDILSLSITLRPSGPNFTGFGFNPNPANGASPYLTQNGYGWVYYEGLLGANTPNIQIFQGASTAGAIYFAMLNNPALNFDATLPTTFEYTYSAGAKTLSLSAVNGASRSTLLDNANVSTIPLGAFSNFSLQFQGQTLSTDAAPAYVDRLSVSIIPEPSTYAMALCGLGAMTAMTVLRRRRR